MRFSRQVRLYTSVNVEIKINVTTAVARHAQRILLPLVGSVQTIKVGLKFVILPVTLKILISRQSVKQKQR